ncbi:SEC-C metal-binding domain-containing protein [Caballeronia novacaledonica]|uniref:Prepilin peptidase n=1 Tax=Caballeronia novacaledonica TaxID=1544861 RepID=A0AA37I5F0_9BURK|nr:SEC-C metal-binding domain-containing protein [Caballeronia novacaledonica]GJH23815.1 prepilin peptidase [Caballeronia novacaledonica]
MKNTIRPEHEVFADLAALCLRPGYVHALAYLCFRDNVIMSRGPLREADLAKISSPKTLIRTEISTLQGLMLKGEIGWQLPAQHVIQDYIDQSDRLLAEIHECLSGEFFAGLTPEAMMSGTFNPFSSGKVLREPIFYSGDSAYSFQYRDIATRKYAADAEWLQKHKGFTADQASLVAVTIEEVLTDNSASFRQRMRGEHPDNWTMLPLFMFTAEQVAIRSALPIDAVELVLCEFALPPSERNIAFNSLHDFNVATATPLLRTPTGEFVSLQSQAIAEAVYEAPFYWMCGDRAYAPTLTKNRGQFTETFVADRLALVFGQENVYSNVDIFATKAAKVSDIDVLVVWGDRVLVVQAKSKRLTLEARKGNDLVIKDDFKKAVQAAYDQAAACAKCVLDTGYRIETSDGQEVKLPGKVAELYVLCVVSDHYPALSFQAKQFLKTQKIERVQPPLLLDVFALDAMTEMLQTPLQFLSYVNRRAKYDEQLLASQELAILGYHLKQNLWVDSGTSIMHVGDDFTAGLDIAMLVRRTGAQGADTPDGVLTRFKKTALGRLVRQIESRPEPVTIDLGFHLLSLSEDAVIQMSRILEGLAVRARGDGKLHDATFPLPVDAGITFHCTDEPTATSATRLEAYCRRRKYCEKAKSWIGLCLDPKGLDLRFAVSVQGEWKFDEALEAATQGMAAPTLISQAMRRTLIKGREAPKVGRNDPCPCGSGKKHKKCCLV